MLIFAVDGTRVGAARRGEEASASGDDFSRGGVGGTEGQVLVKPRVRRPPMYRVLLLNDDYTPMAFVVAVLQRFFGMSREAAEAVMLRVHHHGVGLCGVYTYEVAEIKVKSVQKTAQHNQHPLECRMEPEEPDED